MEKPSHQFSELFAQLGLPSDPEAIAAFLRRHTPMAVGVRLPDAPFWSPSQATFLRESLQQDSDWSGPADSLAKSLQSPPAPACAP